VDGQKVEGGGPVDGGLAAEGWAGGAGDREGMPWKEEEMRFQLPSVAGGAGLARCGMETGRKTRGWDRPWSD
jgi:hypothetical protein